jgi:hypothetical protein
MIPYAPNSKESQPFLEFMRRRARMSYTERLKEFTTEDDVERAIRALKRFATRHGLRQPKPPQENV